MAGKATAQDGVPREAVLHQGVGSTGNAGNRDNSGFSGGSGGKNNPQLPSYSVTSKDVGDAAAKTYGMQPGLYFGYMVDDYGNVIGQFEVGIDDANGQDPGPLSAPGKNGGMHKEAPLQGPGRCYWFFWRFPAVAGIPGIAGNRKKTFGKEPVI
ncbi:hypothetical protein IFU02_002265 (plasmid) [Pantoea agglomerans]|uniref:hypothetical protein n=1 Tax=Enterobacter agglomerans TaxID=549 RepID=UPI0011117E5D|nr:hypothetical protein [Pantoea agglomerans]WVL83085.1 hypothetical protein IFU02_002265 [Pantoea agglomerans]